MTTPSEEPTATDRLERRDRPSLWNWPNALCVIRLVGSAIAVGLVIWEATHLFLGLLVVLLFTDWLDGKLAILLHQQTRFGARLDTVADVALYSSLLFGVFWLKWDVVRDEWVWLAAAMGSYALSVSVGLIKFGRVPSYHTRAAKTGWLLVSVAAVSLFADWSLWPLRVAAAFGVWTNLEATAMTCVLSTVEVDVPSIWHAWKIRHDKRTA